MKRTFKENEIVQLVFDDVIQLFSAAGDRRAESLGKMGGAISQNFLNFRASRIGFLVITQQASLASSIILNNSETLIITGISGRGELRAVENSVFLEVEQKELLANLEQNQAFVFQRHLFSQGVLCSIDFTKNEKLTEEERQRLMKPWLEKIRWKPAGFSRQEEEKSKTPALVYDLLCDIRLRPFIPSVQRGKGLSLNNESMKKSYKFIESQDLARPINLNVRGRGSKCIFYWLTSKGLNMIGKKQLRPGKGNKGIMHVFIQLYFEKHLKERGFSRVQTEKIVSGVRTDVYAEQAGRRIVFEICVSTYNTEYLKALKIQADILIFITPEKKTKEKLSQKTSRELQQETNTGNRKIKICALYEILTCQDLTKYLGIFKGGAE